MMTAKQDMAALKALQQIRLAQRMSAQSGHARAAQAARDAEHDVHRAHAAADSASADWTTQLNGPAFDPDLSRALGHHLMEQVGRLEDAQHRAGERRERRAATEAMWRRSDAAVRQSDEMVRSASRARKRKRDAAALDALADQTLQRWSGA